jgi:hypothetical protein
MPYYLDCPYLGGQVELTDERDAHIVSRHPEFGADYRSRIARVLLDPDAVHRSEKSSDTLLFSRWYDDLYGGKYAIVVVAVGNRNWIVTGHPSRMPVKGRPLWARS